MLVIRHVLATALVVVVGSLLGAGAATASCAVDERSLEEQLAEASVAFVGTVTDVRHDTTAQFEVTEVWLGDVPARVVVKGGPDEPDVATSVDRTWTVGTTYLVVPTISDGELHDDSCSPTREWSEDLAELRPAGAQAPEPAGEAGGIPTGVIVGGAIAALVLAVVVTMVAVRPGRTAAGGPSGRE